MGYISVILASILCAGAPLESSEAKELGIEQSQAIFSLGQDTVSSVRKSYKNGQYSKFLKEMDESYKNADLSGLIEMRQKDIPVDFQEQWESKFSQLQKQRNQELLAVVSDKDTSILAKKVRSVASDVSTEPQEKAIAKLNSLIAMAPNSGANADENTLIAIDLEYEYKILHAQMPLSNVSPEQIKEHQLALRMEKMDKMVEASKTFQDHALKQAVALAAANLDARLARNIDGMDLNNLVKSQTAPTNETEEQIYAIISSYQDQFSNLMKEINNVNKG
jgi:hypothetical protein